MLIDWKLSPAQIFLLDFRIYNCPGYFFLYVYGHLESNNSQNECCILPFQTWTSSKTHIFERSNQINLLISSLIWLFFPSLRPISLDQAVEWIMLELRSEGCVEVSPQGDGIIALDLHLIKYERNCRSSVLLEHWIWEGQQWERTPEMQFRADYVDRAMPELTGVFTWECKSDCVPIHFTDTLWPTGKITNVIGGPHYGCLSNILSFLSEHCHGASGSWGREDLPFLMWPGFFIMTFCLLGAPRSSFRTFV